MYPAFYIAYAFLGILFALMTAFRGKRAHTNITLPATLLTLVLPSVGYGWWHYLSAKAENPKEAEAPGYYILTKMAWVHGLYPVLFAVATFYLECFYYEYFNWERVTDVVGVSIFVLFFLGIPVLGTYALVTMIVPALIGNNLKRPAPVMTDEAEKIINAEEWERKHPADNPADLSYRVDDEYIALDNEDDDDNFTIDLK